jgi:hypothetical protein
MQPYPPVGWLPVCAGERRGRKIKKKAFFTIGQKSKLRKLLSAVAHYFGTQRRRQGRSS